MPSKRSASPLGETGVVKRSRNPNWSQGEERALVEAVESSYDTLFGAHSNKVTEEVKQGLWLGIAEKVNASGSSTRDISIVKKKWSDYKSSTKKKASKLLQERKKTGGGEPDLPDMNAVEDLLSGILQLQELKVVKLIGIEGLQGVTCGIDTSLKPNSIRDLVPMSPDTADGSSMDDNDLRSPGPSTGRKKSSCDNARESSAGKDKKLSVGLNMLDVQNKILQGVESIAHSLKELVTLQKLKMNVNITIDMASPVEVAEPVSE